jgi:hypothetical protein
MSVEKYFVEGLGNEEMYEELKASKIFPLVRELQFTYGLKVYQKSQGDGYMMCHPNGFAVSNVWYDHDETQFKYRSPWYKKQRGSSQSDKETVSSVKISSLMATLKRMEAVPPMEKTTHNYVRRLTDAVSRLRRELGSHNKDHGLTGDEVHALMLTALGKTPNSNWVKIDQNKCQLILDKFEEADKIKKTKIEESNRFFTNPFYMIGVDINSHYLVGKFKLTTVSTDQEKMKYETVEPFKRYKSYEDLPDLIPVMTMVKLAYETSNHNKQGVIPIMDGYDPNLDAVFFYHSRPTVYDHAWMVTPCSAT